MDKGQHLRLFLKKSNTKEVIALATNLTLHVSAQTEDSTTKDSTDTDGFWQENEVTGLSYDFQIGALIGVESLYTEGGMETANTLNDIINGINDEIIDWELAFVTGDRNRTVTQTVATGQGKLSNVNPSGQNRQKAQYTATLNGYGPYEVS